MLAKKALIKRINSELVRIHSAETRERSNKEIFDRFINATGNVIAE